MSKDYECKIGWLLSMDKNGEYVPFFVRVRDKDIVPSIGSNFPIDLKSHNLSVYSEIKGLSSTIGKPHIEFEIKGWKVNLYSDYTYEAKKSIKINQENFSTKDGNVYVLIHREMLPIISSNEDLFVWLTTHSNDTEIFSVVPSYHQINTSGKYADLASDAINICLSNYHNNLIDNIEWYTDSCVNIKVEGKTFIS